MDPSSEHVLSSDDFDLDSFLEHLSDGPDEDRPSMSSRDISKLLEESRRRVQAALATVDEDDEQFTVYEEETPLNDGNLPLLLWVEQPISIPQLPPRFVAPLISADDIIRGLLEPPHETYISLGAMNEESCLSSISPLPPLIPRCCIHSPPTSVADVVIQPEMELPPTLDELLTGDAVHLSVTAGEAPLPPLTADFPGVRSFQLRLSPQFSSNNSVLLGWLNQALAHMPGLVYVDLASCGLDLLPAALFGLPCMSTLMLNGNSFTSFRGASLEALEQGLFGEELPLPAFSLPRLVVLGLEGTCLTTLTDVAAIAPNLVELSVADSPINAAGLPEIDGAAFPSLARLNVSGCRSISRVSDLLQLLRFTSGDLSALRRVTLLESEITEDNSLASLRVKLFTAFGAAAAHIEIVGMEPTAEDIAPAAHETRLQELFPRHAVASSASGLLDWLSLGASVTSRSAAQCHSNGERRALAGALLSAIPTGALIVSHSAAVEQQLRDAATQKQRARREQLLAELIERLSRATAATRLRATFLRFLQRQAEARRQSELQKQRRQAQRAASLEKLIRNLKTITAGIVIHLTLVAWLKRREQLLLSLAEEAADEVQLRIQRTYKVMLAVQEAQEQWEESEVPSSPRLPPTPLIAQYEPSTDGEHEDLRVNALMRSESDAGGDSPVFIAPTRSHRTVDLVVPLIPLDTPPSTARDPRTEPLTERRADTGGKTQSSYSGSGRGTRLRSSLPVMGRDPGQYDSGSCNSDTDEPFSAREPQQRHEIPVLPLLDMSLVGTQVRDTAPRLTPLLPACTPRKDDAEDETEGSPRTSSGRTNGAADPTTEPESEPVPEPEIITYSIETVVLAVLVPQISTTCAVADCFTAVTLQCESPPPPEPEITADTSPILEHTLERSVSPPIQEAPPPLMLLAPQGGSTPDESHVEPEDVPVKSTYDSVSPSASLSPGHHGGPPPLLPVQRPSRSQALRVAMESVDPVVETNDLDDLLGQATLDMDELDSLLATGLPPVPEELPALPLDAQAPVSSISPPVPEAPVTHPISPLMNTRVIRQPRADEELASILRVRAPDASVTDVRTRAAVVRSLEHPNDEPPGAAHTRSRQAPVRRPILPHLDHPVSSRRTTPRPLTEDSIDTDGLSDAAAAAFRMRAMKMSHFAH